VESIRTHEKELDPPRSFGSDPAKAPGIVLFFGPWKELRMLVDHAGRIGWEPILYAPGSRVRKDVFNLPDSFQGKIVLSYPTVPSDVTEKGAKELAGLQKRHGIPGKHPTAQIAALSAAKVLVEGLKQAGKDLDRETFVLRLEKMYDFDTGLTPRIGYGPNRRVGALGAHLIRVDREKKAFVPLGWFSPEGT
jgi:ABC-type branched-subunit amino acid transport system substrate-binding protein